jgi:hypothetical protein
LTEPTANSRPRPIRIALLVILGIGQQTDKLSREFTMKSNDDQTFLRSDSFPVALMGTAEYGPEDPTAALEPVVAPPSPMPQRTGLFAHRRRP